MAEVLQERGVKSVQEINATFTATNSGTDKIFEIPLATAVNKPNSHFEPTGQAASYQLIAENLAQYGLYLKGITIKDDGSALEIRVFDNQTSSYRITGYVIEEQ